MSNISETLLIFAFELKKFFESLVDTELNRTFVVLSNLEGRCKTLSNDIADEGDYCICAQT